MAGYDGSFIFDNIGKEYMDNIPYVEMRLVSALFGAMVAPIAYATMRNFGFSSPASILAAVAIIFENAFTTGFRFIMLDSFFGFFIALTCLMWSEFLRFKNEPFSVQWWQSLTFLGVALGLTLSVKWVGLFTVGLIGVSSLVQLWDIITDRTISLAVFRKHFYARFISLCILPLVVYVTIFRIHFALLTKIGDDSVLMGPEFRSSLIGAPVVESYLGINCIEVRRCLWFECSFISR